GFNPEIIESRTNCGFARAHNVLIGNTDSEYILVLNPDTILRDSFLSELVQSLEARPDAGSASGKLLRLDNLTIDSTGIIMLRNEGHVDGGAGEPDLGQFDKPDDIFGASGAAALYRRAAIEDVSIEGKYFDEDFFAYREDADLAWRLRLMKWNSI